MNNRKSRSRRVVPNWRRPGLIAVIATVMSIAIAACGLQRGTHVGCSNSRVHHARKDVKVCGRAAIRVRLDIHSAGAAAGTAILPLDFTNVSTSTCRLAGFPVVTLTTSRSGRQIGTAATADKSLAATTLELPAGRTAHIWLRLFDVTYLPVTQCRPVSAAGLRVTLPGQTIPSFISHALTTCAKPVRGTDIFTVEPFRLGQAVQGAAQ